MRISDMTGDNSDFGSNSPEAASVENGMNLSRYSNEDLFEEIARRHSAVIVVYLPHKASDASSFQSGSDWLCAGMAGRFVERLKGQRQ